MFYLLKIVNGKLMFNWGEEQSAEYLVIRNKLTKKAYYKRKCNGLLQQNGIILKDNGIPEAAPLEVVSQVEGREDRVCKVLNTTPYKLYYRISIQNDGSVKMSITLPPEITEDLEIYIPEELVYYDMTASDGEKIRLYLPKLRSGENQFLFMTQGLNCRIDFRSPKIDDDSDGNKTISGVFKLING